MGMPVSALCDRETTDWPKSQLVFLDCVVRPGFVLTPGSIATTSSCLLLAGFGWPVWAAGGRKACPQTWLPRQCLCLLDATKEATAPLQCQEAARPRMTGLRAVQIRPVYETLAPLAPSASAQAMQGMEAARSHWLATTGRLSVDRSGSDAASIPSVQSALGMPKVPSNSVFHLEDVQ